MGAGRNHNTLPDDPHWYRDAVIYQLHVRAFFDSSNDGVGDFRGLIEKLDYVASLGIDTIWLLPFYPSPLRDDGYDISRYEGVHPSYGTLRDFRQFLRAAHDRRLRVITELVINHTSDQHPWFEAARHAPPGSSKRNYYVWSDSDQRYPGVRIIFKDTERSNWTWDPVAKAYYWHRFFHHQPDLNFDNPRVRRAVGKIMRFWLDLGVDGLRLDAVPYLIERDGTNCENLPETHAILREIRRDLDATYTNRMLLAEANQWPADVSAYFGDGDECHMAFHFPLMPRMFMAVKQEDRHPITEILRQTPEIPEGCQWMLFLRNHDELTLEMVTDEERDYLYASYAADPQMRLNQGIRRRLAPLLDNDRGRIQLLHSLLMSLPGTPVLYYGDELGMGDNIYLGDRNGVRTPMQWTGDRNGGFSRADPARLFAPPIMDPVYGYQAVNVEAQERSPSSLLKWFRRIVALRRSHPTFGRGSMRFLFPRNRKVLAFVRQYAEETILVVANLARSAQPAELDLSEFAGLTPIEMLDRTEFPRIGELPYFLTLAPHQFYWFRLEQGVSPITAMEPLTKEDIDSLPVLMAGPAWETLFDGHVRTLVEREGLPPFLRRQRWFGGKARSIAQAMFRDWVLLTRNATPTLLTIVEVVYDEGPTERYCVPLTLLDGREAKELLRTGPEAVVAKISGARTGVLCDATVAGPLPQLLLEFIRDVAELGCRYGRIGALPDGAITAIEPAELEPVVRGKADQSNTSIIYGRRLLLKLFRKMEAGPNPDYEVARHLAQSRVFDRVPPLAGGLEYRAPDDEPTTLAVLQGFVESQADGWTHALGELARYYEGAAVDARDGRRPPAAPHRSWDALEGTPDKVRNAIGGYLESAATLGRRTAELHLALTVESGDPAFDPEPLDGERLRRLASSMCRQAESTAALLQTHLDSLDRRARGLAEKLLRRQPELMEHLEAVGRLEADIVRSRVHGDYHLGQVLWVEGDYVVLDFEGEPARTLEERRAKQSPLKDVGGMVRSFAYAAHVALRSFCADQPTEEDLLRDWATAWHVWVGASFLREYHRVARGTRIIPQDEAGFAQMLLGFTLDKAVYEVLYELNNRPEWVGVPLSGVLELLGSDEDDEA